MSIAVVLLQFWVCDNPCWTLCCRYCVTSSQSDSQIDATAVTALSYSQYHQTANCTNTCEAPTIRFFQSLIVPWWKLIYYVCMLFCMQNTKIYKKTSEITIQGLSKAEDHILCPDWMTVFFLNSFHVPWCLPEAGLLTVQPTFTEILSADSRKSSSLCFAMVFGIIFLPIWMWWKEFPESVKVLFWFNLSCTDWDGRLYCRHATVERG